MAYSRVFSVLLAGGLLASCAAHVPRAAQEQPLLDAGADDVDVLTSPAAERSALWSRGPDGVIAVAGKPVGFVATRASYTNYRLHVEWRWPGKPGNGGVLLHVASGPKDKVWPLSLQVQTKYGSAGDLLPMAGASFAEPLSSAPGAYPAIKAHTAPDSEKPAGQWNSMDVTCRDGTVDVAINGIAQNHVSGVQPRSGPIGFQLEGVPYELRNLRIETLD
jgi:hypothetical protein